jgi:RNA polymerase-binding transcription factor DksA
MTNDEIKRRLEAESERLNTLIGDYDEAAVAEQGQAGWAQELSSYDQHPADQGTETFEQEKALSILEQHQAELKDVLRAFKRLEEGAYGSCEACGEPIADARLEARPAARYCVEDQKRLEQGLRPRSNLSN